MYTHPGRGEPDDPDAARDQVGFQELDPGHRELAVRGRVTLPAGSSAHLPPLRVRGHEDMTTFLVDFRAFWVRSSKRGFRVFQEFN